MCVCVVVQRGSNNMQKLRAAAYGDRRKPALEYELKCVEDIRYSDKYVSLASLLTQLTEKERERRVERKKTFHIAAYLVCAVEISLFLR